MRQCSRMKSCAGPRERAARRRARRRGARASAHSSASRASRRRTESSFTAARRSRARASHPSTSMSSLVAGCRRARRALNRARRRTLSGRRALRRVARSHFSPTRRSTRSTLRRTRWGRRARALVAQRRDGSRWMRRWRSAQLATSLTRSTRRSISTAPKLLMFATSSGSISWRWRARISSVPSSVLSSETPSAARLSRCAKRPPISCRS